MLTVFYYVFIAVVLDVVTTLVGLRVGLVEAGPVARHVVDYGPAVYAVFEVLVVSAIYVLLRRRVGRRLAALAAGVGPLAASVWNIVVLVLAHV